MIHCKRAYEAASTEDGVRVLVDRLWPRNCRKDELPIAEWLPEVAPSHELRKAFKAGAVSFEQFKVAYRKELAARPQCWWRLVDVALGGNLTLVYAAKSTVENNAVVLAEWLEDEVEKRAQGSSPVCYLSEFPDH
ncbi:MULTISPECIES: DUF488 domain-containing protein [Pseudomonas]|uniref:DUF488 family protein n=1 Tax=Pseudomonas tehranensis TaxID=2745502 RepID=A0ABR6UV39_9PSED|nr:MULTISPECIES: DUF488 family protein [Pseudomonas]MBC3348489.1 DUF488 family protein [Pseudomonas tehranensis]SFG76693.1 Uncharacterized conserved protein YeaO, DUF488 family [Pseudomonas sp. NFACC45]